MYTSLKLSKLLQENGFEGESEYLRVFEYLEKDKWELVKTEAFCVTNLNYPVYDILNDLCIRYAKEMFGEELYHYFRGEETFEGNDWNDDIEANEKSFEYHPKIILHLLQQNKQDEAEEYLWKHCKFNKNN